MKKIAIIGGGAAGMFCAANLSGANVAVFESSGAPLKKVLVSGGGRCNFTNENIDSSNLENFYPRGANNLRKPFRAFGAKQVREFFDALKVPSKVEDEGRVFPKSDDSADIARALISAAKRNGAKILANKKVDSLRKLDNGRFEVSANATTEVFDAVAVCIGGEPEGGLRKSLEELGHSFETEVPSLFALNLRAAESPKWRDMSGISAENAEVSVRALGKKISARGAVLITHFGIGGPAVLKLSAFAAREFFAAKYKLKILVNWIAAHSPEAQKVAFLQARVNSAKKKISNAPLFGITQKLWNYAVEESGANPDTTLCNLPKDDEKKIIAFLTASEFDCSGKSAHKAEFVTCGGIKRSEVDFSSMQSRIVPNLFFAGECLDIDAVTGGYNLHSAWSTGKICADFLSKK